ncbi:MAG TPA: LacI family DNA-binding transcriptional regulator [Armatimonadota bacterium]|jgi:LacI family repressor for deo operon, udp, cdd, tsx, nupC, and nupG
MSAISNTTLNTIALTLGVSRTTAHAALSGSGRVSEATRKRVCDLAAELGYTPNMVARALRTQRTGNIALVVPTIGAPHMALILRGIEEYATTQGYNILLACAHGKAHKERELMEAFLGLGVEGLLLYTDCYYYPRECLDRIVKKVPLVLLENTIADMHLDMVGVDQFAMGVTAGELLRAHGRRQQGYLLPYPSVRGQWSTLRAAGQQQAAQQDGDVSCAILGETATEDALTVAYVMQALQDHYAAGKPLDGLFAANDEHAYLAIHALQTLGLRVPEDVAVIGCDDHVGSDTFTVPVTTFQQPMEALGWNAGELLFRRMNEQTAQPPTQDLLPASLIVRASCGAQLAMDSCVPNR